MHRFGNPEGGGTEDVTCVMKKMFCRCRAANKSGSSGSRAIRDRLAVSVAGSYGKPVQVMRTQVPRDQEVIVETANDLAKKYGLEQYLGRPDALNEAIFNLMLLQETMQLEQAQRLKVSGVKSGTMSTRRTVHGAFIAGCTGDTQYRYAVETALKAGTTVMAVFHRSGFVRMLRSMGVPESAILQYCDSVIISDDTHCGDLE